MWRDEIAQAHPSMDFDVVMLSVSVIESPGAPMASPEPMPRESSQR
jgi:hypothetical protein